jgi:disulfide oxidoreductase YuzD
MDKNGKLFGKLSIIDLFAVIILIGAVAVTCYKIYSPSTSVNAGEKKLTYTLKISGVRDFTYEYYDIGHRCFDKKTDEFVGEIVGIREEPYRERVVLLDGSVVYAEKPGVITVYLEIETAGTETDAAFFAGGTYELKAGSELNLRTKYVDVMGIIDNVYANE